MPNNGNILELGCGGGRDIFPNIGPTVGIDLSLSSLKNAKKIYDLVIQGRSKRIHFPDNFFDDIVSGDLLGYISFEEKDKLISEIYRCLKLGGRTIHIVETGELESGKIIPRTLLKRFM